MSAPLAEWLSASEIAQLGLPELPTSKAGVIERAKKHGWKTRPRAAQGGGIEYRFSSLTDKRGNPLADRLVDFAIGAPVTQAVPAVIEDAPLKSPEGLNGWQREVMQARAALLGWLDEHGAMYGQDRVILRLVELSKKGQLPSELAAAVPLANAKSGRQSGKPKQTLSRPTLYNWLKARREEGVMGLAPKLSSETDLTIPAWAPALLEQYRRPVKPSLTAALEALSGTLPDGVEMPSYDQARRFVGKLSAVTKNKGRMGPQALKSLKAYVTRDTSDLWPGAVFTGDGHTFKATVENPFHGQPFRPEATAVLDVYTRYIVGWSIGLAENSIGVLEALSHAMVRKDCGRKGAVPAIWYTDLGSGFKANMLEATGIGFYDRWGISPKNSIAGNSQARGMIERFQQFWVKTARMMESYAGRDMDREAALQRKRITDAELKTASKAPFDMTWEDFKAFLQDRVDTYNNTPHSGLPRVRDPETKRFRYLTPTEAWEAWEATGGQAITIDPDDAADLVRPYERRKVSRCEVRVLGNTYFSHDLDPYHGDDVQVGYDIHDGSKVYVRDFEGRLLAVAEIDGNSRPYFDNGTLSEAVSFQQRVHNQRIKGRLNRVETKRREILSEADTTGLLSVEYQEVVALEIEQQHVADQEYARLTNTSEEEEIEAATDSGRPKFSNELTWAKWVAENPLLATEKDKAQLRTALRKPGFTQILNIEGVEVEALKTLAA